MHPSRANGIDSASHASRPFFDAQSQVAPFFSWGDTTARHEGGHQVLALGDEYPERDEKFRATSPEWFREERVRTDHSVMGPGQHNRFAMFHERHFAAVATFLESIFPGCKARLIPRARPIVPDFRFTLGGGYSSLSGLPGGFVRVGFDLGLPVDRVRRWMFTLGPEFTALFANGDQRDQRAFLLGARLGLEGSTGGVGFGLTGGPFVSVGYGWFGSTDYANGGKDRSHDGAYGEVGARIGIRSGFLDDARFQLNFESALGSALGAPGIIGPIDRQILTDPARSTWVRFGLTAAFQL